MTVAQMEKSLGLQINEVAALWTPIYDVVHPGHWDPTKFSEYSREHFINLRNVSYRMIRDMVDALTTGGTPATMNIGVDARIRYLLVSSSKKINNIAWPTINPHLPPETSIQAWSSRADMYELANASKGLVSLLERLGGDLPIHGGNIRLETIDIDNILSSIRGRANPNRSNDTATSAPEREILSDDSNDDDLYRRNDHRASHKRPSDELIQPPKASKNSPNLESTMVAHLAPEYTVDSPQFVAITPSQKGKAVSPMQSQSNRSPPNSTPSPKNLHSGVSSTLITPQDHRSDTGPGDSDTSKDSDDQSEGESEIFDPMAVLHDDVNPGLSTFLQIGGEHVNVTDEMLARIEEMVATEWDADHQVIAGVIETEDAWEEITRRSLRLGRLSFTGAAAYVIQGLAAEYNQAAELVRHFVKKMDRAESLIQQLNEARIRAEQNRYILDSISAKRNLAILNTAREQHKHIMQEYGPAISPTSPSHKRKNRDNSAHLHKTLKKVRRSGGRFEEEKSSRIPSGNSSRMPSGIASRTTSESYLPAATPPTATSTRSSTGRASHYRKTPSVHNLDDVLPTASTHDHSHSVHRGTPSKRDRRPVSPVLQSSFHEEFESLDN